MFDVITFGSATKDVFIKPEDFLIEGESICFALGSKIEVKEIKFSSGGGGTNSAATFAKQGFSVAYCGKIGKDHSADLVIKDLDHYGVDRSMVSVTTEKPTNHSIIISVPEKDRTILAYRGASDLHTPEDIDLEKLKAKWFYITACSSSLLYYLLDFANQNGIRVMLNPGKSQIKDENFKKSLKRVDVLLLNKEEGTLLTEELDEESIAVAVSHFCEGVLLITKGKDGVTAFHQGEFYKAKPATSFVVERTGAGDSFGSAFLSAYIRTGDIEEGVALGIANSASCLQKAGAKRGLLGKDDSFQKVYVQRSTKKS